MNNADMPAMPCDEYETFKGGILPQRYSGLSKRELFAMAAMQGLLASGLYVSIDQLRVAPILAVVMAGDLLAQLSKEPQA